MECRECLALVQDYYDDILDIEVKDQIHEHMQICAQCRTELEDLIKTMQYFKDNIPCLTLNRRFTEQIMMNIVSAEGVGPFAVPIFGMGIGMILLVMTTLALIGPTLGKTVLLMGELLSGLLNSFVIALGEYHIPQVICMSILLIFFVCIMAAMRRVAAHGR